MAIGESVKRRLEQFAHDHMAVIFTLIMAGTIVGLICLCKQ